MGALEVDWDALSKKLDDTAATWVVLSCLVIPVVHVTLHRYVFTPAGKVVLGFKDPKKTDEPESAAQLKKLEKFQESAWKLVAYTALSIASGYALLNETCWKDKREFWTGCSRLPCEFEPPARIRFAYALDMAYYTYAIPYCILVETKRKDFAATFVHHIVTVVLIGYSYALGFSKAGVVVMFLHDVCDPLLELAKLTKYAGQEALTNSLFILFTLTWILMRCVYYPAWVIWSVVFDSYQSVLGSAHHMTSFPHWHVFSGLLIFLWILHLYWTYVLLRIAAAALSSGAATDDREDED